MIAVVIYNIKESKVDKYTVLDSTGLTHPLYSLYKEARGIKSLSEVISTLDRGKSIIEKTETNIIILAPIGRYPCASCDNIVFSLLLDERPICLDCLPKKLKHMLRQNLSISEKKFCVVVFPKGERPRILYKHTKGSAKKAAISTFMRVSMLPSNMYAAVDKSLDTSGSYNIRVDRLFGAEQGGVVGVYEYIEGECGCRKVGELLRKGLTFSCISCF
ncbi:hypothetical protein D3C81_09300 [compost metagenome]